MKSTLFCVLLSAPSAIAICPNSCSGNGVCGTYDQCTCNANYRGSDCSQRICPYASAWVATPKGDLNFDGDRRAYTVYNTDSKIATGTTGSTIITQELSGGDWESWPAYARGGEAHFYMECANRGLCDRKTGMCECFPGYEGYACNRMACPNDCSGKGVCQSTSYLTSNPDQVTDAWYDSVQTTSAYAFWDGDMAMACKCDAGYSGPDCSTRNCPVGDDVLTTVDQVAETQFIDIKTTCEGSADCTTITEDANSLLTGSITLTYTDSFGEAYTTEPIDGVSAFGGSTTTISGVTRNHALATNAQAALRALPNNVVPDTVTVSATFCDVYEPITVGVSDAGLTTVSNFFRVTDTSTLGGSVLNGADGVLVVADATSATHGGSTYTKGAAVVGITALTAPVNTASLVDPLCIRLVVNFDGIPGDLAMLKVNVDNVQYAGYTNAQHSSANVAGTVSETVDVATGGLYSYVAPSTMIASAASGASVTNEATCASGSRSTACTVVNFAADPSEGALGSVPKLTFYPKTKIEISCTKDSVTRSLGTHEVLEVTTASYKIILDGVIPASTISASGCSSAGVKVVGKSHFFTTGVDPDSEAAGSETGVNMATVAAAYQTGSSHSLHFRASYTADGTTSAGTLNALAVNIDHASAWSASHSVAVDTSAATAMTFITILESASGATVGKNAAAASVGTILSTENAAHAALITTGDNAGTSGQATVTFTINGKGTRETSECGARGLCDTEAGECKCFPGYIGLSCSTQSEIAV